MFKRLSLYYQLLLILVVFSLALFVLVMPFINQNLARVIDDNLFEDLNKAQSNYLDYGFAPTASHVEEQIYHLDIDMANEVINVSKPMTIDRAYIIFNHVVKEDLLEMINDPEVTHLTGKKMFEGDTLYYVINDNGNDKYTISILYSTYSADLVKSIQNQIIYILYGVIVVFFIIVALWLNTLIYPLKKIDTYIKGIKSGERRKISIRRKDEIGTVFTSLVEMENELEKQNQIKEEMIHNISHDLKTPITLIQTYSQSVKDDIYPYGSKEASMDVIIDNADRLERKVRSLLHLNRLDYLSESQSEETVDMEQLVNDIVRQFRFMYPNIEFELNLEQIQFVGDIEAWRIAIENILANGSRYVKNKFVITLKQDCLTIYNDGEHFDEDIVNSMFNPYEKGNKGQFGLGLSIVKKTCDIYGYNLSAHNEDIGVSFTISKK